jgi:hypothetical protein
MQVMLACNLNAISQENLADTRTSLDEYKRQSLIAGNWNMAPSFGWTANRYRSRMLRSGLA